MNRRFIGMKNTIIPRLVQVSPFQNSKYDEDPSVDLEKVKTDVVSRYCQKCLPPCCENAADIPIVDLKSSDWTWNFRAGAYSCPTHVRERILSNVRSCVIRQRDRARSYELLFIVLNAEKVISMITSNKVTNGMLTPA
jgi:hypothetical protein